MSGLTKSLFKLIRRGKSGRNKGLSTGFPRLDKFTYGLQRSYFTVYGGDQGSGKSSLALYASVFRPLMDYPKANINILFYSFEMSAEVLLTKLLSLYLYEMYEREISYETILSLTQEVDDETLELIRSAKDWLLSIEKRLTIIDKAVSADGLYATCKGWISNFGEFIKEEEHKETFIPKDPEQYLIVIVDHIRLLRSGEGGIKIQIDKACDYLVYLRNKCGLTIGVVQQLNRAFKSMDRRTKGDGNYQMIQLDDFADSSAPTQSAEVVIAIFHCFREKLKTCEGYNIVELKDAIRILALIKNRFGQSDKSIGVNFFGTCGVWRELPKAEEIKNYEDYKYLIKPNIIEKKDELIEKDNYTKKDNENYFIII